MMQFHQIGWMVTPSLTPASSKRLQEVLTDEAEENYRYAKSTWEGKEGVVIINGEVAALPCAQQVNVGEESKEVDLRESESKEDGTSDTSIGNLATDARKFGVCGYELVKTLQEKWFIEPLEIREINGQSMKQLYYYNRKFGKWLASKNFGGELIIRPHKGGENHVRREWSGWG